MIAARAMSSRSVQRAEVRAASSSSGIQRTRLGTLADELIRRRPGHGPDISTSYQEAVRRTTMAKITGQPLLRDCRARAGARPRAARGRDQPEPSVRTRQPRAGAFPHQRVGEPSAPAPLSKRGRPRRISGRVLDRRDRDPRPIDCYGNHQRGQQRRQTSAEYRIPLPHRHSADGIALGHRHRRRYAWCIGASSTIEGDHEVRGRHPQAFPAPAPGAVAPRRP